MTRPVHCLLSCLSHVVRTALRADDRPLHIGAWDAPMVIDERGELTHYSAEITDHRLLDRFSAIYGEAVESWYEFDSDKESNFAKLLRLAGGFHPEDGRFLIVQLDMFGLPLGGGQVRQSRHPHYALVDGRQSEHWTVNDPFFGWKGQVPHNVMQDAFFANPLGGGFVIDATGLHGPDKAAVARVFESDIDVYRNPTVETTEEWLLTIWNGAAIEQKALLRSMHQLGMAVKRKLAYEPVFAYLSEGVAGSSDAPSAETEIDDLQRQWNALMLIMTRAAMIAGDGRTGRMLDRLAGLKERERVVKEKLWQRFAIWKSELNRSAESDCGSDAQTDKRGG